MIPPNQARFEAQVAKALSTVKTILDNTRAPQLAANVSHSYADKFSLAEYLTNSSIASLLIIFERLGISKEQLKQMKSWSSNRSVTIQFTSLENCKFLRKKEEKVEAPTQHVTEVKSIIGKAKITEKVINTVRTWYWEFDATYELSAYQGNKLDEKIVFDTKNCVTELETSADKTPKPQSRAYDGHNVNVTWLLQQLNDELLPSFKIDRKEVSCRTPRRNEPINRSLLFFASWYNWAEGVKNYFTSNLFNVKATGLDTNAVNTNGIFVPIVPLLESPKNEDDDNESTVLSFADVNAFLQEEERSLQEKIDSLQKIFPAEGFLTYHQAIFPTILLHSKETCEQHGNAIDYIEKMLHDQLVSAIGREIGPTDFAEYMVYHNRKLFQPNYQPKQFCNAVRRPEHDPEGVVTIESNGEPIYTNVNLIGKNQMSFAIDAATTVSFNGNQFVHAWVDHCFSSSSQSSLKLKARARQFSSFILVIGTVISATEFDPKHAVVIQNKDDILIPLLLEQIPTPKAFRDAIESLSPEQQAFAKAFRNMQLDSTLFGMCIIQIKPQLEKLLNLSYDSLTKEIQLTQDLMNLFVEYQIPSDLLSFEGDINSSRANKIQYVKKQVEKMQEMINHAKEEEIAEERRKQAALAPPPPPSYPSYQSYAPPMPMSYMAPVFSNFCSAPAGPPVSYGAPPPPGGGYGAPAPPPAYGGAPPPPQAACVPAPPPAQPSLPSEVSQPVSEPVSASKSKKPKPEKVPGEPDDDQVRSGFDVSTIPSKLNTRIDELDCDAALHSTIVKTSQPWEMKFQKSLLSKPSEKTLDSDAISKEQEKAFDLLDSLTRSGALELVEAELHVLIATTHCFSKTLIDTVVQDNVNPIEKVERSVLIISSTIHDTTPESMIKEEHIPRIKAASPGLFQSE